LREKIAALAAQDLSPGDIASRLKISLSEVDLALTLLGRGR
jgi:DNA-binding CsgD family transcriptional regulator